MLMYLFFTFLYSLFRQRYCRLEQWMWWIWKVCDLLLPDCWQAFGFRDAKPTIHRMKMDFFAHNVIWNWSVGTSSRPKATARFEGKQSWWCRASLWTLAPFPRGYVRGIVTIVSDGTLTRSAEKRGNKLCFSALRKTKEAKINIRCSSNHWTLSGHFTKNVCILTVGSDKGNFGRGAEEQHGFRPHKRIEEHL